MTSDPAKMQQWVDENRVHFGNDETAVPCIKSYLTDREYQAPYSVFYQDGRAATKRLRELMDGDQFDFPKDETVLQELIGMMTSGHDTVMDFFAGSGTTGHAVMAQNAADGGNRHYILVQLPQPLDPTVDSQRSAAEFCSAMGRPLNLAELTKERLRRAAARIKDENPLFVGDVGFRVFKLDSSNFRLWEPNRDDIEQTLLDHRENLKAGRTERDILYELLLKLGLSPFTAIEERVIARKAVQSLGGGVLFTCLADRITGAEIEALSQGIVEWRRSLKPAGPTLVVFRDSAFADDVVKCNAVAILEQGIGNDVRVRSV
jgi:adenine-specific DNA-methyltransferase